MGRIYSKAAEDVKKNFELSKKIQALNRAKREEIAMMKGRRLQRISRLLRGATARNCHVAVSRATHFQAHLAIGLQERASERVYRFEL